MQDEVQDKQNGTEKADGGGKPGLLGPSLARLVDFERLRGMLPPETLNGALSLLHVRFAAHRTSYPGFPWHSNKFQRSKYEVCLWPRRSLHLR